MARVQRFQYGVDRIEDGGDRCDHEPPRLKRKPLGPAVGVRLFADRRVNR